MESTISTKDLKSKLDQKQKAWSGFCSTLHRLQQRVQPPSRAMFLCRVMPPSISSVRLLFFLFLLLFFEAAIFSFRLLIELPLLPVLDAGSDTVLTA